MSSGKLDRTGNTEEYEDDFEDAAEGEASKMPEAASGVGRASATTATQREQQQQQQQQQQQESGSVIAHEIAAELRPAGQAANRSTARESAPAAVPSGPALVKAVINSRCRDVEALLRNGAPIRFTDSHGWTPLHWACSQGYPDVIEAILRHIKESATSEDNDGMSSLILFQDTLTGWTPLHVACVQEHVAAVKLLLAAGADVNVADKQGDKPVDCVKSSETDAAREIVRLLSGEEEPQDTNTGK